ncbi:MAG TPA: ATP-binding protein [Nitrospirota bacterium]
MSRFQNLPLKKKLILIGLLSALIAMLLAGALMYAVEAGSYRDSMVRDLAVKAELVGDQCRAALLFNVRKDAEETLSALRVDPDIEFAGVYRHDGSLFAWYRLSGETDMLLPDTGGHRFEGDHLVVWRPIMVENRSIGWVLIRSNQQKLHTLLSRYLYASSYVLGVALLIAFVVVSRLQRTITRPVMDLVRMMEYVSQRRDFTVRAAQPSEDELGALARGFNEMLTAIQNRDRDLEVQRKDLERTVADLKRLTRDLQEANAKLRALDRIKSDFISIASHELRTPLTSIKAYAELMILKPNLVEEKKRRLLSVINSESDRLVRLINDLLDLSRIETGTMAWHLAEVSIVDIIQNSVATITPLAQNRGQSVTAEIEPGLPVFKGDRDRLIQVMTNLLSNAMKFTSRAGSIRIAARRDAQVSSQIAVSVTDTGVGIPEEDLKIVFDKFQRSGDHLTSTVEGTGLGLAIAREIVEFHGGTIWAESEYGKGSTFTFTLALDRHGKTPPPDAA